MDIVERLQEKYPEHKVKYIPDKKCRVCRGIGEIKSKSGEIRLCVCTCVDMPDIGGLFQAFVKKELKELRGEE